VLIAAFRDPPLQPIVIAFATGGGRRPERGQNFHSRLFARTIMRRDVFKPGVPPRLEQLLARQSQIQDIPHPRWGSAMCHVSGHALDTNGGWFPARKIDRTTTLWDLARKRMETPIRSWRIRGWCYDLQGPQHARKRIELFAPPDFVFADASSRNRASPPTRDRSASL